VKDAVEKIQDRITALRLETMALDGKARIADRDAPSLAENDSYLHQVHAMVLRHRQAGLEEALEIVRGAVKSSSHRGVEHE